MRFYKKIDLLQIKALSFDLDNTLYDCQTVLEKADADFTLYLCERYKLDDKCRDYSFWYQIKASILKADPKLQDDVTYLRELSLVKAFELLNKPLKGGLLEAKELVKIFIKKRSSGYVAYEVLELLGLLKQRYPLISISNGNLDTKQIGLYEFFDYDIRPTYQGLRSKPYADTFNKALMLTGLKPNQILHIGDDPYTDVLGAINSHYNCAWLEKGYTKISPDSSKLRVLPHIVLDNILELKDLLTC